MEAVDYHPDEDILDAMCYAVDAFDDKVNPQRAKRGIHPRERGILEDPNARSLRRNFCREIYGQGKRDHPPSPEERIFQKMYDNWTGQTSFMRYYGGLVAKQPFFGTPPRTQEDTMRLYEFAAYFIPTEKGEKALIVVAPTTVLAKTEDQAKVLAGRAIPEQYADQLDKVTIVVRPFC